MGQRLIGLIGTGQGPEVSLRSFREPIIQIVGMGVGDKLLVQHADGTITELYENGNHPLPRQLTVRLKLEGSAKKALCFIIER